MYDPLRSEMKKQFIDHLRYYRHQVLNDIQLIKAYLSLGKIEEAQKSIDQMVIEAHDDAKVSQMGQTELAYFLLIHKFKQEKIQFECDIEMETEDIPYIDDRYDSILPSLQQVVHMVEEGALQHQSNHLYILFRGNRHHNGMMIEYEGSWDGQKHPDPRQQLLEVIGFNGDQLQESHSDSARLYFRIKITV